MLDGDFQETATEPLLSTRKGRRKLILQTAWVGLQAGKREELAELLQRQVEETVAGDDPGAATAFLMNEGHYFEELEAELDEMARELDITPEELHSDE